VIQSNSIDTFFCDILIAKALGYFALWFDQDASGIT